MRTLIKNVEIVTMDSDNHYYPSGVILFSGDTIEYVGIEQNLPANLNENTEKVKEIDGRGMLALPGFVNAHTHSAMTIFRGYADNLPLWEWLTTRIWPLEEKLQPGYTYWLSMLAAAEMISAGVTAFSDMYMFMTDTAKAVEDSGMRAVLARGLMGPDDQSEQRHKEVEELAEWRYRAEGRIHMMISPHAVYTCSPEYLKTCRKLAEKYQTGIHIHMSETAKEVADCVREYGKTPVRHLYDLGIFELPVAAAHCVHLTDDDMDLMAENHVKAIHCPSSNMKLASGFAPVDKMIERGITVALGSDGAASSNNLSIFKEMSLASLIAKGYTGNATALSAETAVKMATIMGAKALMLQDEIGSLEPGKKADIQLIDMSGPHYYPKEDPLVHLVYSGYSGDVDTVIINGKIVMEHRKLTTIDLEQVYREVDNVARKIK
ncbi:MAG TPA: amidohydrolase [Clostridiales bacterium]|nr:amidohydrolase [Clostridiales bacterium]